MSFAVARQSGETTEHWAYRLLQFEAWSHGHDPACPFNSVQPCAQHPNPYADENYPKEK